MDKSRHMVAMDKFNSSATQNNLKCNIYIFMNIPWYYNTTLASLHLSHVTRKIPFFHDMNTLFYVLSLFVSSL